jgi:hypothetical protein
VVHLESAALAPFGRLLRARLGTPVSAAARPEDLCDGLTPGLARALDQLDEAFVFGSDSMEVVGAATRRVVVTRLPAAAHPLPHADGAAVQRVWRCLRAADPQRPVVILPWPENRVSRRRLREGMLPWLPAGATYAIIGGPAGWPAGYRLRIAGRDVISCVADLDPWGIAALAAAADAVVVAGELRDGPDGDAALRLSLAVSGAPVVAFAADADVLDHEQSALLAPANDARALAKALASVLALPPVQRRALGGAFAAHALRAHPEAAFWEAYRARFLALAGRPPVPEALRSA